MKSLRVYLQYSQHRRLIGLVIAVYPGFQQVFYHDLGQLQGLLKLP